MSLVKTWRALLAEMFIRWAMWISPREHVLSVVQACILAKATQDVADAADVWLKVQPPR